MTTLPTKQPALVRDYITVPNVGFLARIGRCASTSLAQAIVTAYYPDGATAITSGVYSAGTPNPSEQNYYPEGQSSQTLPVAETWLSKNGAMVTKPTGTVFAVVRDPTERFLAACAAYGVTSADDIAAALTQLQAGQLENIYEFASQLPYLNSGQSTQLYNFDTDLGQLASDLGLGQLPNISLVLAGANVAYPSGGTGKLKSGGTTATPAPPTEATLTSDQTTAVQAYYANDAAILASLTTPGQVYTPPVNVTPTPPTPGNPAPKI